MHRHTRPLSYYRINAWNLLQTLVALLVLIVCLGLLLFFLLVSLLAQTGKSYLHAQVLGLQACSCLLDERQREEGREREGEERGGGGEEGREGEREGRGEEEGRGRGGGENPVELLSVNTRDYEDSLRRYRNKRPSHYTISLI